MLSCMTGLVTILASWEMCLAICSYCKSTDTTFWCGIPGVACSNIRLSGNHLGDISQGDPTVVMILTGLGASLVTSEAHGLLGDFCHLLLSCQISWP